MAVYLVTGGAGFIGSNICDEIIRRGGSVRIFDDFSTGKHENLPRYGAAEGAKGINKKIEVIKGSVSDIQSLVKAAKDVDYVLHLAAISSVSRSIENPIECLDVNLVGTKNVLEAARKANARKFVFSSSSAVYGEPKELPNVETAETSPLSPYAEAKLAAEEICRRYNVDYGIETVSLRYFNVFGPRQDPNSDYAAVIPKFITAMLAGKRPVIFGDGKQSRDFTYVKDVVEANLLCIEKRLGGEKINIASGKSITILGLVESINQALGKSIRPVFSAPREGDIVHSSADISLAGKKLGYVPSKDFDTALKETIAWFKVQPSPRLR